jgi:hypothetical protein
VFLRRRRRKWRSLHSGTYKLRKSFLLKRGGVQIVKPLGCRECRSQGLGYDWNGRANQPTIGEFKDGRGEFFDQESFHGRAILVRNVWSDITPNSCRFEQAFSDDGGKTWELNWIATDTRVKAESDEVAGLTSIHQ